MSSKRRPRAVLRPMLLLTVLLGFGLRVYRLGYQELRGDETFGYFFSLPSLSQIVERTFELQEPHPVASYFVQSFWLDLAGHSEFSLRFPTAWFSLLAVALLARLAHSLGQSAFTVLLSTLLMAVSPYAIWHGQDARMYSMSLALTIASSWFFVEWVSAKTEGRPFEAAQANSLLSPIAAGISYIVVTWLALHTHYFAAFVVISQCLFVLVLFITSALSFRAFLQWIGVEAVLSLAYLPWLISARHILTDYGGNGDSPGLVEMLGRASRTFAFGETISAPWVWVALVAILYCALFSLRESKTRTGYLLIYMLVPLVVTWISALQRPIFDERYLIAALPPFLLLISGCLAGGVSYLQPRIDNEKKNSLYQRGKSVLSIGLAMLVGVGITTSLFNHYANGQDSKTIGWRQLAQSFDQLTAGYDPDAVRLVQNYPDPTLWYYYRGNVAHLVLPPSPHNEAGTFAEIEELTKAERGPVYHVVMALQPADNWDHDHIAERGLSSEFTLIAETAVASWPVQIYSRVPALLSPLGDGEFVNGLVLSHASVGSDQVVAGGVLSVHLGWRASAISTLELTGSEKLFLHLIGPDNTLVAQQDVALQDSGDSNFATELATSSGSVDTPTIIGSYGILIPADAPEGTYHLIGGLYDPDQEGAPRILVQDGRDSVLITEISVREFLRSWE